MGNKNITAQDIVNWIIENDPTNPEILDFQKIAEQHTKNVAEAKQRRMAKNNERQKAKKQPSELTSLAKLHIEKASFVEKMQLRTKIRLGLGHTDLIELRHYLHPGMSSQDLAKALDQYEPIDRRWFEAVVPQLTEDSMTVLNDIITLKEILSVPIVEECFQIAEEAECFEIIPEHQLEEAVITMHSEDGDLYTTSEVKSECFHEFTVCTQESTTVVISSDKTQVLKFDRTPVGLGCQDLDELEWPDLLNYGLKLKLTKVARSVERRIWDKRLRDKLKLSPETIEILRSKSTLRRASLVKLLNTSSSTCQPPQPLLNRLIDLISSAYS